MALKRVWLIEKYTSDKTFGGRSKVSALPVYELLLKLQLYIRVSIYFFSAL